MRFALFCLLFLIACTPPLSQLPATPPDTVFSRGSPTATLGDQLIALEIADTPSAQMQGLMFRESLDSNSGMLFVFNETKTRTFWMKNTKIPIDILFLDEEYRIVTLYRDVPPCTAMPCELYSSLVPVPYALEVNAGQASLVKEGDALLIKR